MKTAWFKKWWVIAILVVVALYGALVVYRAFVLEAQEKTAKAVERIHGTTLTMRDVTGENLPPRPSAAEAAATVEGIDANENGIRDDVELAIFEKYPGDIKIRAAVLQYAMALQMHFAGVFNSATLVAVIQEEDRGYFCMGNVFHGNSVDLESKKVEELILNTKEREHAYEDLYTKYMTSYGDVKGKVSCDLDLGTLL